MLAGIGGLVFLVLVCAIIHCCVRKKKEEKKGMVVGSHRSVNLKINNGLAVNFSSSVPKFLSRIAGIIPMRHILPCVLPFATAIRVNGTAVK